jgi:NitT/TauT family transport system substrate-binding protein
MRPLKRVLVGVLAATALALTAQIATAAPTKIRVSFVVPVGNWMSLVYEKKDLMPHYGKTYEVEVTRFQGTTPMITALAAGELDIADLAYSSFALAIENAGMNDLRAIADEVQDGYPGYASGSYYVLKDGPIQTVKDLKGKVIASVGAGTAVDIAIRAMLKKNGLEEKRDYTMVEAGFPSMKAMLLENKAQLVTSVQPFSSDPEFVAKTKVLFNGVDALGGKSQFVVFTGKEAWLKANRAAVVDWLEDSIRAIHWFLDPKNREEALEICARISKQPKENFNYVFTKADNYRDPNMLPDIEALQRAVDAQQSVGYLKAKMDMSKYADLSLVKEAGERVNGK